MPNKYDPKTKTDFDAYRAAMDEADAAFTKPPKRKSGDKSGKKNTGKK